ncbi:ABC transporter substrate-binding protein [Arthrobacter sp. NPDC093139]|uniref:ABC transporter substrate-binding protein n=1 Tax=Arthrobacter sp. NPDC093139 TaxID=3363945 RepID=UPI003817CF13
MDTRTAKRRRNWSLGLVAPVLGLSLALTACGGGSEASRDAAQISEDQQRLYEEAVNAGKGINLFVGTAANKDTDQLIDRFHDTFPDLKVEYVSGTGNEVTERLLTEKRSGLHNADALLVAGISTFKPVAQEKFLADFVPQDAELFTKEKGVYLENQAYSFGGQYNGVCYNPNNVTPEEAESLRTYDGWIDSAWKGRAAIVSADGSAYRRGLSYWLYQDKELGPQWLEKLSALNPTTFSSGNVVIPQVIAGEYDLVFNVSTVYGARAYREGAPLECVSGERAPYSTFATGVIADAPNKAGAELFTNWLFSEAGQKAVQDTWAFSSLRDGFETPVIDADWWQAPEDPRVIDEDVVNSRHKELVTTFNSMFGAAKG